MPFDIKHVTVGQKRVKLCFATVFVISLFFGLVLALALV